MKTNHYMGMSWSNGVNLNNVSTAEISLPNTSGKVWRVNYMDVLFNHDQNASGAALFSALYLRDLGTTGEPSTVYKDSQALMVAQGSQLGMAVTTTSTEVNSHPIPVVLDDALYLMDGFQLAVLARNMGSQSKYDATVVYQVTMDIEEVSLTSKIQGEILSRK